MLIFAFIVSPLFTFALTLHYYSNLTQIESQ
nr:MAG TPA: hypothetical protein [Caudoviricetes sp.]